MGIKQLYNDNLRKLPNEYGDVSVMYTCYRCGLNVNGVSFRFLRVTLLELLKLSPVKRICVFEHSVMTNFNCACPAIQRDQGSGCLSEGSS